MSQHEVDPGTAKANGLQFMTTPDAIRYSSDEIVTERAALLAKHDEAKAIKMNQDDLPSTEILTSDQQKNMDAIDNYRQSSWRYVNVLSLFAALIAQSSLMMQFSPVLTLVRDAYQTSDFAIGSNGTVFLITLAILDLPSVYLLDSGKSQGRGMSIWFKIASFLTIIGQWGRYFSLVWFPDKFWLTIFPCTIMAVGQPFLINGVSKLACIWFGDNQRALAIGITGFGLAIGTILGLAIGSFFIQDEDKYDHAKIRRETEKFMLWVSWGTTVLCAPMILFYKQRPVYYPSRSAEEDDTNSKQMTVSQMMAELKILMKNRNFICIMVIFAMMDGSYTSLGTLINFLFEPFGFSSTDTSIMGATFVVAGLISSIMFPLLIEKYHWFLRCLKVITIGSFISSIIVIGAVPSKIFAFAVLAIGLLGFFVIPTMSVTYAFATEVTYPISEALFGSLMQAGSGLFATIVSYIITIIINKLGSFYALTTYVVFFLICAILAYLVKEDLRRLKPKSEEGHNKAMPSPMKNIQQDSAKTSLSLCPEKYLDA